MYFRSGWIWSKLKGEWQKMKAQGPESHKKTFRFCSEYIRKSLEVLKLGSITVLFVPTKGLSHGHRKTSWEARS